MSAIAPSRSSSWGRVAILMSPDTSRCWRYIGAVTESMRESGNENADGLSHRLLTVVSKSGGVRYAFHAVYAPTGDRESHRKFFFQERVRGRLEQPHRPRTRLPEVRSARAPAADLPAQSEDAQLTGRGGLVAHRLLCAPAPQEHLVTG